MKWNRNLMYDYLKSLDMYPINRWADNRRSYHIEFVPQDKCYYNFIDLGWGYIRRFKGIHLCQKEVVITSDWKEMKINIDYEHLDKFEVKIFEYD